MSKIQAGSSKISPRSSNKTPSPERKSDGSIDMSGKWSDQKMKIVREVLLTNSPNSKAVM